MDRKSINKRAGMTLIEVVIAFALLVITAAPLLAAFAQSLKSEMRTAMHNLTTYEAQMKMEEAYGMTAADLLIAYTLSREDYTLPGSQIELYRTYEVHEEFPGQNLNLYHVTVKIEHDFYKVETEIDAVIPVLPPIPVT